MTDDSKPTYSYSDPSQVELPETVRDKIAPRMAPPPAPPPPSSGETNVPPRQQEVPIIATPTEQHQRHDVIDGPATYKAYGQMSDAIEYTIHGHDMQFVEVILDPDEAVIAENGAMIYFDAGVQMDTRMGDGSKQGSGVIGSIVGATKRKITNANIFLGYFENKSNRRCRVAFSAPTPGMIIPIDLSLSRGEIFCQKGAFLCGSRGTSINIGFTKRMSAGMFGGEGFILQRLKGDGYVFIHAGGAICERTLAVGETVYVDTGNLVAFETQVEFDIRVVTGVKNIFFGDENLFLTSLQGPGKIWLQSMPFGELAHTMYQTILNTRKKSSKRTEG